MYWRGEERRGKSGKREEGDERREGVRRKGVLEEGWQIEEGFFSLFGTGFEIDY